MQTARLYLLLLVGVLWVAGCGQDRSTSSDDAPSPDTVTTTETTPSTGVPDTTAGDGLRVLVLGNSIAAGLGVSSEAAFPARLQQRVDSLGWNVTIQNAGVSGETTAGGLRRIEWLLQEEVDVLVLELGGNDGLRGVDPAETQKNLTGIIDTTFAAHPDARVLLTAMRIPRNLGTEYVERFRQVFPTVADQYAPVTLVQFDERLQAGADSLIQDDGIHPTAAGHRLVARDVWTKLRPLLEEMRAETPA